MSAANENTARLTQFKNKGKDATVSSLCVGLTDERTSSRFVLMFHFKICLFLRRF